jgi:IclR family transcriptional regulator, acetate operon repressor
MASDLALAARAFDLIEAVAAEGVCSLATVAERTGISFSAVHRLAQLLIERGYLIAARRGAYCLGPSALALGTAISPHKMLETVGRPILDALAREISAPVHLGIFEDDMVTYLVKSRHGRMDLFSIEGMQLEAYCSAIGKVLLAHQPQEQIDRYLGRGELVALTPNTFTDPEDLRRELALIRARGWALDNEEILPGLRCLARPVTDAKGAVLAALSISFGPAGVEGEIPPGLLARLSDAAAAIAGKLGVDQGVPLSA